MADLKLKDLRYLVAVADTRHFGRAAERSFVSQPTLSAQLKKLEEYLGVQLILGAAPGVVHVFAIGRNTEQLRVTRLEFLVELAERGDFRRAHEGEVLRPEEDDAPLALVRVLIEGLERLRLIVGNHAGERILGKFLADT